MKRFVQQLEQYGDVAYAIMRMVVGILLAFHGSQKIFGLLSTMQPPVGSQIWFGGLIELVCGLTVLIGFHTHLSAFLASGTMAVAYFQYHWKFQMGEELIPAINKGELAVLYCFILLYIACRGGIRWCVDKRNTATG